MKIVLINPPLVGQRGDPFGSIPSIPVGTPYLAAYLRERGVEVSIIDAFGEDPHATFRLGDSYLARGLDPDAIAARIPKDADIVGVSVHSGAVHGVGLDIVRRAKGAAPGRPVVVGGAQPSMQPEAFLTGGADYVVLGEGEESLWALVQALDGRGDVADIDGLAYPGGGRPKTRFIEDLDALPWPAVDLLPLENYWKLGYSHGPFIEPYLFLITSRGCPFACRFCAAPELWQRKWRARSAANVVDEMEHAIATYGVRDFHIQDDNFTFKPKRTREICEEIGRRDLKVSWCLAAGMKAETVDEETLAAMRAAGCRYISVSPETGSPRVLKLMDKPFDYEHFLQLQRAAGRLKVKTQVCFVLGFPGETDEDLQATGRYLGEVTKAGADEVALFIMTPLPGAAAWGGDWPYGEFEALSFSPRWRPDYHKLARWRRRLFAKFFLYKALYHPLKLAKHPWNVIRRRFETKSEMTVYRMLKTWLRGG